MSDFVGGLVALLGAFTAAFTGNQGGVVLALVLILGLGWKLRQCDKKHDEALDEQSDLRAQNQRLTIAAVQLVAAVNAQAGYEVVSSASLEEMLAGKPAVKYAERRTPGRRKIDTGAPDGKAEPAGGSGNVSA